MTIPKTTIWGHRLLALVGYIIHNRVSFAGALFITGGDLFSWGLAALALIYQYKPRYHWRYRRS